MDDQLMIDLVLFGGVITFLIISYLLFFSNPNDKKIARRIDRVREKTVEEKIEEKALSLRRAQDNSLDTFGLDAMGVRTSRRLQKAKLDISARNYIFYCLGGLIFLTLILWLLARLPFIVALLLAFVLAFGVPHFYVGFRIGRSQKKFLKLFPDAIELIVRGLRAGLPVTESMITVAQELPDPVSSIFSEINSQIRLGIPVEKAMSDMARSLKLTEFDFFVISVSLQRETGGNLGEILSNLAEVLRQRHMLKLKIKAMSSEARASAVIVGALPIVVVIALLFVSPGYLEPLISDTRGNIAVAAALAMMGTGSFIMSRMAKFKI